MSLIPYISKLTLKSQCDSLILTNMIEETLKKNKISNRAILLLDKKASKILSSFVTMTDCLNRGLYSIESLLKSRKSFPNLSAIYLIFPCQESIDLIIKDIKNKLYKKYYIFFIGNIKENLIEKFLKKNIVNKIKAFKEICINFSCFDNMIYQFNYFDNFNSFFMLMNKNKKKNYKDKIELISERLFNIIKVMNINPNIVYFNLDNNCKEIANSLWEKLNYNKKENKIDKNIILITSRLLDLTGPLLFDLSYSNLIYERFKEKSSNKLKLNSNFIDLNKDPLYYKYKSMTLPNVLQNLSIDLNNFMKTDTSKIKDKKNLNNLNSMEKVLNNYNDYKYITNSFKVHLKLGEILNNYVKENNLLNIIDIQNNILCGIDSKGKKIKNKEILKLIEKEIKNDNIKNKDLIKLLSILNYYNSDINFNLEELIEKINDLNNDNININKKNFNLIKFFDKENTKINENDLKEINKEIINFRKKNIYYSEDEENEKNDKRYLGYFESKLNTIINLCCKNKLNENYFTFLADKKKIFQKSKSKLYFNDENVKYVEYDENSHSILLFNLGGLSYYEIGNIYKGIRNNQFNYNIIIGSNKFYNSDEYLEEINNFLSGNEKDFEYQNSDEEEDEKERVDENDNNIIITNNNVNKKKNVNIDFDEDDENENEIDTMKTKLIKNKKENKKENKKKNIEMKNSNFIESDSD